MNQGTMPHCVSWGVGFLMGALVLFLVLFDRLDDVEAEPQVEPTKAGWLGLSPEDKSVYIAALGTQRANFELSSTPTATVTATMTPTKVPTVRSKINDCGTATPGAICQKPPLPTATTTPYPDCNNAKPAMFCQWPEQETE